MQHQGDRGEELNWSEAGCSYYCEASVTDVIFHVSRLLTRENRRLTTDFLLSPVSHWSAPIYLIYNGHLYFLSFQAMAGEDYIPLSQSTRLLTEFHGIFVSQLQISGICGCGWGGATPCITWLFNGMQGRERALGRIQKRNDV